VILKFVKKLPAIRKFVPKAACDPEICSETGHDMFIEEKRPIENWNKRSFADQFLEYKSIFKGQLKFLYHVQNTINQKEWHFATKRLTCNLILNFTRQPTH
jgi:hypothetical protein